MAGFPSTRLLDKFNRANGPLGSDWTALSAFGADMPNVLSNAAVGGGGYKGATWNGAFSGDQECYVTLKDAASAGIFFGLFCRLTGDDGYQISYDPLASEISLSRVDNGTATPLDVEAYSPGDGHIIGISAQGSTIRGWVYAGGTWTKVFEQADATYSSGSVGFHCYDIDAPNIVFDDFGGGNVGTAGTPPANSTRPRIEGVAETGLTVTCNPGAWTGDATVAYDYQWQRSSVDIPGEESSGYLLAVEDEAQDVRCRVLAYNAAGVGVAYSLPVASIASTEGQDDTLIAVAGEWVPVQMHVAVDGDWI